MRVFVTGATGHIGSLVVAELIGAGHRVVGLARSDASAAALAAAGAEVHRGALDNLESLHEGAAAPDGVIHTAFVHDFSNFADASASDLRAIETLGAALEGSGKPLVVTSGTTLLPPGRLGTEDDAPKVGPRVASENAAISMAGRGVRSSAVRPAPSVHGPADLHGFVPTLVGIAREKGVSAFVGDGTNRWPAVHELDTAHLYRLALETAPAGSRLHAVGDEGIPVREIAEVIGRHLGLPVSSITPGETDGHFGWIGAFFSMDIPASSALTRELVGWRPEHPGLIEDLDEVHYFRETAA